MARLGRGQPFRPQFSPALQAEESTSVTGPAPANVTVAAPMGTVSVSLPGPVAAPVAVAAPVGKANVSTAGTTPPNVAVAAPVGTAVSGAVVVGAVASVAVAAPVGTVSVTTPQPPGSGNLTGNPAGAGNSTLGWTGFHGTLTASSSPPSGCPEATAFQWVNDGVTAGAIEAVQPGVNVIPATPTGRYTVSAWVYSSVTSVQIGFDWRNSGGGYISTSALTTTVPANTWTLITTTQTAVATAVTGIPRVGSSVLSSTVWATDIFVFGPNVAVAAPLGQAAAVVNGLTPNVSVAAPMGTVSVSTPGPQVIGASSFDAGNLDGWGAYPAGASVVASNLWSHSGNYSDLLTGDGTTASPSTLKTFTFAGGSTITQGAWLYSPQGLTAQLSVDVYTSGGTYIQSFSKNFTLGAGVPQYCQLPLYMPANAGQGHFRFLIVGTPPNTTQLFVDDPLITITPSVPVAAQLGSPNTNVNGLAANVAVSAPMGAVSVTTPGPAAPNVSAAAPTGLAHYVPNTVTAGPVAPNVQVVAPAGGAGGGATSPPAGVTVRAYIGTVSVVTRVAPATVVAAAHVGTASVSTAGATAHVASAAPTGHPATSVTVPAANVSAAASAGTISTAVASHAAAVAASAPAGTVRITLPAPVTGVSMGAPTGSVGVSATASASCTIAAPIGSVGTSVPGRSASVFVAAPGSPLVAGLYKVTATATMEFGAWGAQQRRVWFGYGVVNTLNVPTKPPGE